jgi:CheY-like chemotaxis protein
MTQPHILVVEDEGIVALELRNRLQGMGYHIAGVADSGEHAIEKAARLKPDLILMDIKLKGQMDGVMAAEQIRINFDIPIIYLTAYADEHTLQRAKITTPYGYVLKPFEERNCILPSKWRCIGIAWKPRQSLMTSGWRTPLIKLVTPLSQPMHRVKSIL